MRGANRDPDIPKHIQSQPIGETKKKDDKEEAKVPGKGHAIGNVTNQTDDKKTQKKMNPFRKFISLFKKTTSKESKNLAGRTQVKPSVSDEEIFAAIRGARAKGEEFIKNNEDMAFVGVNTASASLAADKKEKLEDEVNQLFAQLEPLEKSKSDKEAIQKMKIPVRGGFSIDQLEVKKEKLTAMKKKLEDASPKTQPKKESILSNLEKRRAMPKEQRLADIKLKRAAINKEKAEAKEALQKEVGTLIADLKSQPKDMSDQRKLMAYERILARNPDSDQLGKMKNGLKGIERRAKGYQTATDQKHQLKTEVNSLLKKLEAKATSSDDKRNIKIQKMRIAKDPSTEQLKRSKGRLITLQEKLGKSPPLPKRPGVQRKVQRKEEASAMVKNLRENEQYLSPDEKRSLAVNEMVLDGNPDPSRLKIAKERLEKIQKKMVGAKTKAEAEAKLKKSSAKKDLQKGMKTLKKAKQPAVSKVKTGAPKKPEAERKEDLTKGAKKLLGGLNWKIQSNPDAASEDTIKLRDEAQKLVDSLESKDLTEAENQLENLQNQSLNFERIRVMGELIETEKVFLREMQELLGKPDGKPASFQLYEQKLIDEETFAAAKEAEMYMEEVIESSKELIKSLETKLDRNPAEVMTEQFSEQNIRRYFEAIANYSTFYSENEKLLSNLSPSTSKALKPTKKDFKVAAFNDQWAKKTTSKTTILAHFMTPVQRGGRHELLAREMLGSTGQKNKGEMEKTYGLIKEKMLGFGGRLKPEQARTRLRMIQLGDQTIASNPVLFEQLQEAGPTYKQEVQFLMGLESSMKKIGDKEELKKDAGNFLEEFNKLPDDFKGTSLGQAVKEDLEKLSKKGALARRSKNNQKGFNRLEKHVKILKNQLAKTARKELVNKEGEVKLDYSSLKEAMKDPNFSAFLDEKYGPKMNNYMTEVETFSRSPNLAKLNVIRSLYVEDSNLQLPNHEAITQTYELAARLLDPNTKPPASVQEKKQVAEAWSNLVKSGIKRLCIQEGIIVPPKK